MDEITGFEQLQKRVEWLDSERRNDKTNIASLLNRLSLLESENNTLRQQVKELSSDLVELSTQVKSTDKYEKQIERVTTELNQKIKSTEEKFDNIFSEAQKRTKLEIEATNRSVSGILPMLEPITPIQNDLRSQKAEDIRLGRLIEELKQSILEVSRFDEDYKRSLHLLEESRRQDLKRVTDMQGEIVSLRKRVDDSRSRIDLYSDNFRQIESRINEFQAYEKDRREAQSAFIDKINLQFVENNRVLKEWRTRLEAVEKIDTNLDSQLKELETTRRTVTKALSGVEEVTQRFERRINEISEIQRLNDERFRQEWTAFKADDLKRWTNYSLSQEEAQREHRKQAEKNTNAIESINDNLIDIQDNLQQTSQQTIKRLQALLRVYQEALENLLEAGNDKS